MKPTVIAIVAAVVSLALAGTARADWTLGPSATGVSQDAGDGTYEIAGTYSDPYAPNGFGHYRGTITASGDFTSCRDVQVCVPGIWSHCNVASGEVTFQSGVRLVTVFISGFPSMTTVVPVVCQFPGTTTRALWLELFNIWAPAESVRGYGPLFGADGLLAGTSVPRNNNVYEDNFDTFSLFLQSRT
jgi:hypothetical protein